MTVLVAETSNPSNALSIVVCAAFEELLGEVVLELPTNGDGEDIGIGVTLSLQLAIQRI